MSTNIYSAPAASLDQAIDPNVSPVIWNPTVIVVWGFLLSPIFGAFLQMRNWEALGEPDRLLESKRWVIASLLFTVGISAVDLLTQSNMVVLFTRVLWFTWFFWWYVASARHQSQYVLSALPTGYTKRGWLMPLVIGIACYCLMFIAFIAIKIALRQT